MIIRKNISGLEKTSAVNFQQIFILDNTVYRTCDDAAQAKLRPSNCILQNLTSYVLRMNVSCSLLFLYRSITNGMLSTNILISRNTVGRIVITITASHCKPLKAEKPKILPMGSNTKRAKTNAIPAALTINDLLLRIGVLKTDFELRTWKMCSIEVQPQIRNAIVWPIAGDGKNDPPILRKAPI